MRPSFGRPYCRLWAAEFRHRRVSVARVLPLNGSTKNACDGWEKLLVIRSSPLWHYWSYDHVSREGDYMTGKTLLRPLMLVMVMMLFVAACSSDGGASGPVTIETSLATGIDFSTQGFSGPFEVTEGADTLGCSAGTWEDTRNDEPGDLQSVSKFMTCSEGDTGTFTINYIPGGYDTGTPQSSEGPWHIEDATADFTGLEGEGDYATVGEAEILTGNIEYSS
jgi:hypothetical protein